MIAAYGAYVLSGSEGESPDMAQVALTTSVSVTAIGIHNLSIEHTEALEPVVIRGERPGADIDRRSGLLFPRTFTYG